MTVVFYERIQWYTLILLWYGVVRTKCPLHLSCILLGAFTNFSILRAIVYVLLYYVRTLKVYCL